MQEPIRRRAYWVSNPAPRGAPAPRRGAREGRAAGGRRPEQVAAPEIHENLLALDEALTNLSAKRRETQRGGAGHEP